MAESLLLDALAHALSRENRESAKSQTKSPENILLFVPEWLPLFSPAAVARVNSLIVDPSTASFTSASLKDDDDDNDEDQAIGAIREQLERHSAAKSSSTRASRVAWTPELGKIELSRVVRRKDLDEMKEAILKIHAGQWQVRVFFSEFD